MPTVDVILPVLYDCASGCLLSVSVASTAPKTSRNIPASQKALVNLSDSVSLFEIVIASIWACNPAKNIACPNINRMH